MGRSTSIFCVLLNVVFWSKLAIATGPPTLISEVTQRQIARVGDKVRLSCPVEADPTPLIQWSKDGESITRLWERFKTAQLQLRIKDAEVEDTGTYECKATNGFGHVTVDYILIVLEANQSMPEDDSILPGRPEKPRFTDDALMQENVIMRPVGQNVRLHCPATGSPPPEIKWYKNGQYFDATLASRNVNIQDRAQEYVYFDDWDSEDDKYTLSLPGLEVSDSGDYKCVVSNMYGTETFTYTLQVMASMQKPIIVPPNPQNTTVTYGATASFTCEVRSLDQPLIQWLKRVDGPINPKENTTIRVNDQQFVVLKVGKVLPRNDGSFLNKLTINNVRESDSGMYICLGANSLGYNFRSAFLTVLPTNFYQPGEVDRDQFADDYNGDYIPHETSSFWDNKALPIIIGVPAGIILIIIAIIICVIKRKQARDPPLPSPTHAARVQRFPPQQQPYTPAQMEKAYNHQYAALHPQNYTIQSAPSQERITKTYSDKQSDVSLGCPPTHSSGTPPLPPLAPTPTLVQQHTHMHYYQRT